MAYRPKAIRLPHVSGRGASYDARREVKRDSVSHALRGVFSGWGYSGRHRSQPKARKPFGSWL